MKKSITYRIFGEEGHRQRASFAPSWKKEYSNGITVIERNSDITGSNLYSEMEIIADTESQCYDELMAQCSDGSYEGCRVGRIEKVAVSDCVQGKCFVQNNCAYVFESDKIYTIIDADNWRCIKIGDMTAMGCRLTPEVYLKLYSECTDYGTFNLE